LACACLGGGASLPATAEPPDRALVRVLLPSADALDRFEATGLPVFAQEEDVAGAYVLTVSDRDGLRRLTAAGLSHRVLDPDMAGATYYFTLLPPGHPEPDWSAFGVVLYHNDYRLIRSTPADAERLAAQGVELAQLSLEPLALQRPPSRHPSGSATFATGPRAQEAQAVWLPVLSIGGSATFTADPLVQGMIDQVTPAAAEQYVAQLSGETPVTIDGTPYTIATRFTNSGTPIAKATQFVSETMAGLGLAVEYRNWTKSGYTSRNVIGERTGITNPGDIYIIGAHLDDMPNSSPAPGADDNASGSAATLIAADILSQYQWDCTLRFALWTGEEQGLLGSAAYAGDAKTNGETIRGYLNLDMLGYNGTSPRNVNLYYKVTPVGSEQIADTFMDVVNAYGLDLVPVKYDVANYSTGYRSDNRRFWDQGYPAILAIEDYEGGDVTPHYHKVTDKLSTLGLDYFTTFVKAAVGTFAHMSGCLQTGALDGGVTASHNASAIANASITMTDTHDLRYAAGTDGSGRYGRTVPAATYDITASAYGYLPATITDVPLTTGALTQNFVLQAAPPVAPEVTPQVSLSNGDATRLTWDHVSPNMFYTVHREAEPYFTPALDNQQESLGMPFAKTIIYDDPDDLTGSGSRFYVVVGHNDAGAGAPASRVGIFNFALQPGE
jgi:hypothetical protein